MHQLLVVCLLVVLFSVSCSGQECHKDFDLVFVIDGSGSVRQAGEENWGLIKNCVKGVIAGFTIGFTQTHVAAMVFSARSYNVIEMNLNTYYNKSQIDKAIDEMVYPSGGTYTASALRKVKREILTPSQDRKDKPNVVIVITDGKATDWDQLGAAAAALHNITDTTIIAIGVALYYEKELVVMAGGQANVFTAADFEDLENMINEVKQSVCKDCRIDLVLVVDTSGSARDNWHILLKFVTDLADNVNPDPNGTHIGMVTFGDQATKIFDFREFDEGTYDRAAFFRKITSISRPAPGERTFINRGLHLANQEVLREQYGMRPDVRKVVLLITDGIQTILSDPSEPNSSEVSAAMKARGIEIACVGIGGVDGVSLDHFASSQSRVILVIYFTLLDRYVQDTSEILCPVHGGWRGWEGWRGCSVTCGGGSQTRYRSCTGPPPSNGGRDCRGSSKNTQSCNRNSCPVSPQIYLSPQNKSVPEGHPVNFSCKARGDPQPELSWKFNEGELPSGINQTKLDEGSLLELSNTTKDMEGNYKCIATNKANTTTSSAFLHVFEKPSAEVSPNPYPTLTAGDELSLTCKVNEATVKIIWKRNGGPVSPTAQIDTLQLNDKMSSKLYIAEVLEDDSGEYSCEAHNTPGVVARSTVSINVNAKLKGSIQAVSWYYIVGPVAACIFIFAMSWSVWKHRKTAMAKLTDQEEAAEMELLNVEVDKWEIAVGRILLQETIGRGAFGAVQRALLSEPDGKPGNRTVAAKCFTPTAGEDGRKSLMREIELGKLLGEKPHSNIVKFIGCVTTRVHPILVMEYCACGDLLGYLRKSRGIHDKYHLGQGSAEELQIYDLVLFARQIAAGMVFLGSRGIIHRDLAARNVLLDDNYVCKVTDFGLAYQDFKYGHGNAKKGCIPIKWTAPEILSGNFAALSTLSDVWSYGIVLYEIFTIGGIPYPGFSEGQAVAEVLNGYQMPKPEHIDDQLFDVMTRCWNRNPDFRPNFENLRQRMDAYLKEETYTELINMKRYDGAKYSKVDDLGAEDELPELPSVQAKTSSTGKKLEKWSSVR